MNRLALGSAQFGLDYGITNPSGRVGQNQVVAILDLAAKSGIDTIDTARLYGDSESVIGRRWPVGAEFRVVTKTAKFVDSVDAQEAVEQLRAGFEASLDALRRPAVHGLLVHDAHDLFGQFGTALWSALEELKRSSRVARIGVSVYEPDEIDAILERFPIEIVQLPLSPFDHRLVRGGQLEKLREAGVEMHARSVFLQGLMLAPVRNIPQKFAGLGSALEQLDSALAELGLSRLEGVLAIVLSRSEIDRFVVGVTSTDELGAILAAANRAQSIGPLDVDLPELDARYLNPARWHEL